MQSSFLRFLDEFRGFIQGLGFRDGCSEAVDVRGVPGPVEVRIAPGPAIKVLSIHPLKRFLFGHRCRVQGFGV